MPKRKPYPRPRIASRALAYPVSRSAALYGSIVLLDAGVLIALAVRILLIDKPV